MSSAPATSEKDLAKHRGTERRTRERLKLHLPIHIRHVLPDGSEEVAHTIDFSRSGICFISVLRHYLIGTVLFVTLPYSSAATTKIKCLGEVVRVEKLDSGAQIVALKFLS